MKLAWTQESFSFHGQAFHYDNVRLTPKPLQQPHPELWLGGMFPYTIQRAGRSGDAWCSDPFPLQKEMWKSQVALYREAAAVIDWRLAEADQPAYSLHYEFAYPSDRVEPRRLGEASPCAATLVIYPSALFLLAGTCCHGEQ